MRKFQTILVVFSLIFSFELFSEIPEDFIKTALIYKFFKFVTWPDEKSKIFIFCVYGNDYLSNSIAKNISGRKLGNKKISSIKLTDLNSIETCHALFVSKINLSGIKTIKQKTKGKAVFTIANNERQVKQGIQFGFYDEDTKVKFIANLKAIKASNIKVSSKLLKISKIIK